VPQFTCPQSSLEKDSECQLIFPRGSEFIESLQKTGKLASRKCWKCWKCWMVTSPLPVLERLSDPAQCCAELSPW